MEKSPYVIFWKYIRSYSVLLKIGCQTDLKPDIYACFQFQRRKENANIPYPEGFQRRTFSCFNILTSSVQCEISYLDLAVVGFLFASISAQSNAWYIPL